MEKLASLVEHNLGDFMKLFSIQRACFWAPVAAAVLFASGGLLTAQTATAEAPAKEETQEKQEEEKQGGNGFDLEINLASFDQVWKTIDEVHWDEELVGQSWDEARAKYRPQVESAKSIGEVRRVIGSMIDELGLSHYGIIPESSYDVVNNQAEKKQAEKEENSDTQDKADEEESDDDRELPGDGVSGLDFRATDDGIIVSSVEDGSSAAKAGVKAGWVVEKIGKKSSEDLSEKIRGAAHGPMRYETLIAMAVPSIATGKVGTKKKFVLRDGEGKTQEVDLELEEPEGIETKFGNLPAMKVRTKTKTLAGNIGYYFFSAFLDPARVMTEYREAIRDENHANGVVIDLRGNIGGLGGMTMGMASEFSTEKSALGTMITKSSKLKFFVTENYDPVTCPVAVLIDECSISSAEIFSGGLQDLKLARVFGSRSAGLALPSIVVKLPNGDGFQYAIANYLSASGKSLEMDGVTPDEEVPLSSELLLHDEDPVLTRALQWIKEQNQSKK